MMPKVIKVVVVMLEESYITSSIQMILEVSVHTTVNHVTMTFAVSHFICCSSSIYFATLYHPHHDNHMRRTIRHDLLIQNHHTYFFLKNDPNIIVGIAFWSSTFHPCSIFICDCPIDELTKNNIESKTITNKNDFIVSHTLEGQHDKPITSFDWSKPSFKSKDNQRGEIEDHGRIVTCGEDCLIFVWTFQKTSSMWVATQVLLQHRVSLNPLCCQWDDNGRSFAMGMNGNHKTTSIEVFSFQNDNIGWTSRQIGRRKIKSSVLCISWRPSSSPIEELKNDTPPSSSLIACGGCDSHCRIFVVESSDAVNKKKMDFGEELAKFNVEAAGWVTAVNWSETGQALCYVTQTSAIYIVDCSNYLAAPTIHTTVQPKPQAIRRCLEHCSSLLPLIKIQFLDEETLIVGGHCGLRVMSKDKDYQWTQKQDITNDKKQSGVVCTSVLALKNKTYISYSGFHGSFNIKSI